MNPFRLWLAPENRSGWHPQFCMAPYLRELGFPDADKLRWTQALPRICAHMIHAAAKFPGLTIQYLELWYTLFEAFNKKREPTWEWWLDLCCTELGRPRGPHTIEMGHRLVTHLSAIMGSGSGTHSISACNEKRDPYTAILKRIWPSRFQASKFRRGLIKLCRDNSNAESQAAAQSDLRRVVLAYRMGWLNGDQQAQKVAEHQKHYTEFRNVATLTWCAVDAPDLVPAIKAYLVWYIRNHITLRLWFRTRMPHWATVDQIYAGRPTLAPTPSAAATQSLSLAWLPTNAFAALLHYISADAVLRKMLFVVDTVDGPAGPEFTADLEQKVEQVYEARAALTPQQLEKFPLPVLDGGTWITLAETLMLSEATKTTVLRLMYSHYQREMIKTRLKAWLVSVNKTRDGYRDITALGAIFRVWKRRTETRTIPVPHSWVTRVTQEFTRREQVTGMTVSPMCDVFMYCPTCSRICSICSPVIGSIFDTTTPHGRHRRRRKPARPKMTKFGVQHTPTTNNAAPAEPTFSAGFQDVVNDVDSGRHVCASRKTGTMAQKCRDTELCAVHLTGRLLVYGGRVFMLCPQPRCSRMMELEPSVCRYNEYGPCCSICTLNKTGPAPTRDAELESERVWQNLLDAATRVSTPKRTDTLFDE